MTVQWSKNIVYVKHNTALNTFTFLPWYSVSLALWKQESFIDIPTVSNFQKAQCLWDEDQYTKYEQDITHEYYLHCMDHVVSKTRPLQIYKYNMNSYSTQWCFKGQIKTKNGSCPKFEGKLRERLCFSFLIFKMAAMWDFFRQLFVVIMLSATH